MKTLKKSLALCLAVLCILSAFGAAGSAANVNIPMAARTAEKITFAIAGYDDYEFCVMPEGTAMTGIGSNIWSAWNVNCGSSSVSGKKCWIEVSKSMLEAMFPSGELTDKYMVYGRRETGAGSYSYANSDVFRFAPLAPVVNAKTENTVTVKSTADCVYKWEYYNAETKQFKNGAAGTWKSNPTLDDVWQTSNVLTNIEAGSTIAVFNRYSGIAGSDIKESYATYTVVSTYKKAPNKPATPKLVTYTKDTISVTLTEEFPVEFSIDGGTTWAGKSIFNLDGTYTSTNTFDKLTKSTMYSIIARGTITEDQSEGQHSEAIVVKTAARNQYRSDVYACTIELPGDIVKTGDNAKLIAKGDMADGDALEGDTRCIPVAWEAKINGVTYASGSWSTVAVSQTAEIGTNEALDMKYSGPINVVVTFQKQEYANGEWNDLSLSTNTGIFNVKSYSIFDYILGVLNAALTTVFTAIGKVTDFIVGLVTKK